MGLTMKDNPESEALVYVKVGSGKYKNCYLYVMRREDAERFCERPESKKLKGLRKWEYAFSTYIKWRDQLENFRIDDGRNDELFRELGIKLIYVRKK